MSVQQAHWMPDNDNGTHTQTHTDCWRRHNQCKNVRITHWTRSPRAERDWARSESLAPDYRALHRHRNYKTSIWCALDSAHQIGYHSAVPCFDAARCTGKKVKPLLVKEKEGKKKKKRVIKRRRRKGDFCICMCVCVFVCRSDTNFLFTCKTSKCTLAHMYIHWHWLTDSLN